jgi:hypothetical protein
VATDNFCYVAGDEMELNRYHWKKYSSSRLGHIGVIIDFEVFGGD